jgi:hypothetical protein
MHCATEAVDFEGAQEWEIWVQLCEMREQAEGAG